MHGFAHFYDMLVMGLVRFLLLFLQIDDVARLQWEILGHLVLFPQMFRLKSQAAGYLLKAIVFLGVHID